MLLSSLLFIPIIGVFVILVNKDRRVSLKNIKYIALIASTLNFLLSLVIFILFDFSTNQFQFVQEYHEISYFDFYLGVDGLSIYFVLLTTIIIPISLLSNWTSISNNVESYVIIILLLETLLLAVFLVLDILLFYIFFESILPPLFILIGIYGSDNRVKASFYLFLYTLLGSLFLLLSILAMSSIMSTTDFDTLFKGNFIYLTQLFLFYGIFIAFAVKTPTIFLNTWLLKAHVESPLGGSIILAAIVLKLSLYGIFRLILPVLPKAYMEYTYVIFLIGVITIVYASLSTLRTIDVKELIAYSSVSHAAVYLIGVFSNSIQGIEGGINLGLAHGLVSPGLFICAGGVLYDRSHIRLISFYKGMAQIMPLFAILFFILCLGNCGAPLTLNFVGEFMSLYGVFERSSLFGALASSSIVFSAAYTIYMYQRISFGGSYSRMFTENIADLNKREFTILFTLVILTVFFGIYTAPIIDGINYSVSTLIYSFDYNVVSCDAFKGWSVHFLDSDAIYEVLFTVLPYLIVLIILFMAYKIDYERHLIRLRGFRITRDNRDKRAERKLRRFIESRGIDCLILKPNPNPLVKHGLYPDDTYECEDIVEVPLKNTPIEKMTVGKGDIKRFYNSDKRNTSEYNEAVLLQRRLRNERIKIKRLQETYGYGSSALSVYISNPAGISEEFFNFIPYLVGILIILGILSIVYKSTKNNGQQYTVGQANKHPHGNCRHPIISRKQLLEWDRQNFGNARCPANNPLMPLVYSNERPGQICLDCATMMCSVPSCVICRTHNRHL